MWHVQINAAHLLLALPNDPHLLRSLDEVDRLSREKQLTRRAAGPAARLGGEGPVAVQHILIVTCASVPGPKASDLGSRRRTCAPSRHADYPTAGDRLGRM